MKAGCITIPPQYLKEYTPMFEPGFLPLINDHSYRNTASPPPPPPPDNDRVCHASVPTRENFPLHHCRSVIIMDFFLDF